MYRLLKNVFRTYLVIHFLIFASPIGHAGSKEMFTGMACGLALLTAVDLTAYVHFAGQNEQTISIESVTSDFQYALERRKQLYGGSMRSELQFLSGPAMSTLTNTTLREQGISHPQTLLLNAFDIFSYTLGVLAFNGLARLFFSVPVDKFIKKSNLKRGSTPKQVLFLSAIKRSDRLAGYPEATFDRLYDEKTGSVFIQFDSSTELAAKLKELELKGSKFDHIEYFEHGSPGRTGTAIHDKTEFIDLTRILQEFTRTHLEADATLRYISCSLANGQTNKKMAPEFRELTQALLPYGGRVYASNKNIQVFNFVPETDVYRSGSYSWADLVGGFGTSLVGADLYRFVLTNIMSLKRNYTNIQDATEFVIDNNGQLQRKSD